MLAVYVENVHLTEDNTAVEIIDQTLLPGEKRMVQCASPAQCREAISSLRVRGAPAIGIFAGYALYVLATQEPDSDPAAFLQNLQRHADYLGAARPTAVNLRHALDRMLKSAEQHLNLPREKLLETPKEELVCEDSRVFPAADPDKSLSYSDIAYYAADKAHGALFVTHTYEPASNVGPVSADFAEVEVDTYTGHCRLTDFACVHDIGKAINPEVCRSQIGSAVQNGAGMVFCEQIRIDPKTGAIQNTSMERYHVVRAAELPNVKVEFLEDESADGPFGAKSIGEAALVPVVPAILAALNDALGSGFSAVPVTPDKVLSFLESAGKEAAR